MKEEIEKLSVDMLIGRIQFWYSEWLGSLDGSPVQIESNKKIEEYKAELIKRFADLEEKVKILKIEGNIETKYIGFYQELVPELDSIIKAQDKKIADLEKKVERHRNGILEIAIISGIVTEEATPDGAELIMIKDGIVKRFADLEAENIALRNCQNCHNYDMVPCCSFYNKFVLNNICDNWQRSVK